MHDVGSGKYYAEALDETGKKSITRVPIMFTTPSEIANWMSVSVDNKAESSVIAMLEDKFGEGEVVDSPHYVVLDNTEPNPEAHTPYSLLVIEALAQLRLLPKASIVCITATAIDLTLDDIFHYRYYCALDIINELTRGTNRLIYSDIPKFEGDAWFTSADIVPHKSDSGWTFPQYVGDISRISDADLLHVRKYNLELLSYCLASGLTGLRKPHHQKSTPDIGKSTFDSLTLHLPIALCFVKLLSHGRIDLRQVTCIREYLALFAKRPEKVEIIDCHVSCDLSDPNVERYLYAAANRRRTRNVRRTASSDVLPRLKHVGFLRVILTGTPHVLAL